MREIKFRAWDGNKMWEDNFLLWSDGRVCEHLGDNEINYPMDWEIMQFTGLTDKNGKEIYEGDIVKVKNYGREVNVIVEWESPVPSFDEHICGFDVEGFEDGEVIGNFYETPELLEKK